MLIDLINKYASAEANAVDWQGVVNVLTTPSIVVLDDTAWTLGAIQVQLGVDTARTVAAGMKAVGEVDPIVGSAYIAMSTVGMQLHTDDRQAMVDVVGQAAGWSSDLIKSLKELGKKVISPVEQAGIPAPTEAEMQEAWLDFVNPQIPDAQSHEVLLSVNRQADGVINAMAVVTSVSLRDGKVISKGSPVRYMNGNLIDAVKPLIERLING